MTSVIKTVGHATIGLKFNSTSNHFARAASVIFHDLWTGINQSGIQNQKFKIRNSKSGIQNQKFKIRNSKSEIQNQKFRIRNSKSGIQNQKFKIRNSESEIQNQEFKIRNSKSEIYDYSEKLCRCTDSNNIYSQYSFGIELKE